MPASRTARKAIIDNGDGTYSFEDVSPVRTVKHTFKIGEKFETVGLDGKIHKAIKNVFFDWPHYSFM